MTHEPRFLAGLDLGKLHDHSALAIVERPQYQTGFDHVYWVPVIEWDLRIRRLVRFPLHTSYRDLITLVENELHHPELGITTPLIVDATGPGEVFLDFLRGSAIPLVPVNITSGGSVTQSHGRWKRPQIGVGQCPRDSDRAGKARCRSRTPFGQRPLPGTDALRRAYSAERPYEVRSLGRGRP